jgi:hypothetical protein
LLLDAPKEFELQNEQDLAILLDRWLPRTKVTSEQRDALEQAIQFAATVCLETCRNQGRRLLLGWTGPTPGVRQGPSSVKLLHELLEQLVVMRPSAEGTLAALFDAVPPSTLREAILIVVSTRPVNLIEEAERSARLSGGLGAGPDGASRPVRRLARRPQRPDPVHRNLVLNDPGPPRVIGTVPRWEVDRRQRANGPTPDSETDELRFGPGLAPASRNGGEARP